MAVDEYRLKQRNKLLLIVNFDNPHIGGLPGYKIDEQNLRETFKLFNFEVTILRNLGGKEIFTTVADYVEKQDFKIDDCTAFAICTHGADHGKLYGEDRITVDLNLITSLFTEKEDLVGKPKLFFIQACRGDSKADSQVRAAGEEQSVKIVEQSDTFIYYPSFPGHVSYVHDTNGSFFIEALCKVFKKFGRHWHLLDMATKVNGELARKVGVQCQMSIFSSALTYKLYLTNEERPVESVLLKKLTKNEIKKSLRKLNETRSGKNNWRQLALVIFQDNEENIRVLMNRYVGDSLGKALLDTLKASHPDLTVEKFQEVATGMDRKDIAKLLEAFSGITKMGEIETNKDVHKELINLLEQQGIDEDRGWRGFVEEFDIVLENRSCRLDGSPIEELIDLVQTYKVTYSLNDLKNHLSECVGINRPDVEEKVVELIKKYTKEK